jgi:predicted nucleic acid-binding protein
LLDLLGKPCHPLGTFIEGVNIFLQGKTKIEAIEVDPSDNKYLSCAIEGKADFIISGDHHIRDVRTFRSNPIVSPAEFLKLME